MSTQPILSVENVAVEFGTSSGVVRALDGVTLSVQPGETVAVVGESGCGKTTLARVVLGLQPTQSGQAKLQGVAVTKPTPDMAGRVGMVWQDPYASLNPRWKVSRSISEPVSLSGAKAESTALLELVGLNADLGARYPHQLSGGQRQRVAVGRALALNPPLVICDEPTAALDLSIRAQILNLLKDLQLKTGCSFLYISHDLMTVRFLADRVAVMYMGRIVEEAPTEELFSNPMHPYTKALLDSAPTLETLQHLPEAPYGEIPDPHTRFTGCRFEGRCPFATELCRQTDPPESASGSRRFFCHHPRSSSSASTSK